MNHWTPAQWARIERHARAERLCAVGTRVLRDTPYLASHWHEERAKHAQELRRWAAAALVASTLEMAS
jgi:hypothetical protein